MDRTSSRRRRAPSPAMIVACIALFVALGGTSYAAFSLPANSVGTLQLKKGAVTSAKVKTHSLTAAAFAPGTLLRGPAGPPGTAGAPGAAGAAGPSGPPGTLDTSKLSVVSGSPHSVSAGSPVILDTSCPSGHVIGGGYNSGYPWYAEIDIPISTTTWRIGLINPSGSTEIVTPVAYCYAG
jgi:hypothetical protein